MKQRIIEFDFIKGCCVIGMIMHHCFDYFDPTSSLILYLRFITGSFVFVAGFMFINIYLKNNDNPLYDKISIRMIQRGLKLLFLFILLNALIFLSFPGKLSNLNLNSPLENLYTIFVIGRYNLVAFEILIPIAYVMIITGILIGIFKDKIYLIVPLSILLFLYSSFKYFSQESGYNLRFLTIGLLGFSLGFITFDKFKILADKWVIFPILYILYLIFITNYKLNYPVYLISVLINIIIFYIISRKINLKNFFADKIVLFGKYPLFSYVFQIAFLQVYAKLFRNNNLLFNFLLTLLATLFSVHIVDFSTKRYSSFNRIYRIFF